MREWGADEVRAVLRQLDSDAEMLEGWSTAARQVSLFELNGRGRIADVTGDLPKAKHLVVYVPGMGTELWEFDRIVKPRTEVVRSRASVIADGAEVAAISWLGYEPPRQLDVVGAVEEELARAGSAALSQFLTRDGRLRAGRRTRYGCGAQLRVAGGWSRGSGLRAGGS